MLKSLFRVILIATTVLALGEASRAWQDQRGREPLPQPTPTPTPRPKPPKPIKPEPPAPAKLSLTVTPPDSTIDFDGRVYRASGGVFVKGGIKPGSYRVVVGRSGYRERTYNVTLRPGAAEQFTAELEPLDGTLNIKPTVPGAGIDIVRIETGESVGRYMGRASNVSLPPGRYQVFVSKDGHRTAVRDVTIKSAETVSLEPLLELIPRPRPTPAPTPRRTASPPFPSDSAMRVKTYVEGKFVVVVLAGRSGDRSNPVGALDVTIDGGTAVSAFSVNGMLTGYPCQVDFVKLENIAEYSFVEPPGVANQWAHAVVRVRPKGNKRPMRFLINWKGL